MKPKDIGLFMDAIRKINKDENKKFEFLTAIYNVKSILENELVVGNLKKTFEKTDMDGNFMDFFKQPH
jgi:hypothetical protein